MRVAIATESYAPDINGVANSVAHIRRHLLRRGHDVLVIAPRPRPRHRDDDGVVRIGSLPLLGYHNVRLALPSRRIAAALADFRPDLLHLASPFVLGAWAGRAAAEVGLPTVAVYQTDIPGFLRAYGAGLLADAAWRWIGRTHAHAQTTLAPSSASARELAAHGVTGLRRWGRGVDIELYRPDRRRAELRHRLAPHGEVIVGYVGRLAREKQVQLLAEVAATPGIRVVVVGDGPVRARLERQLPGATFLGTRVGVELAELYASFDIFVHTGPHDTFAQTIQEAGASGVPVVAPAVGGPVDLVTPGVNGLLYRPGDAVALAAAVRRLQADAPWRRRLGAQARQRVEGRTWERVVDELIAAYTMVLPTVSPSLRSAA